MSVYYSDGPCNAATYGETMITVRRFAILGLLICCSAASVAGEPCDAVLVQRNVISEQMARETFVAWLRLIDERSFEQIKRDAAAESVYYGYFAGSYAEFDEKRRQRLSYETFKGSDNEYRSILRSTLPSDAIENWGKCIAQNSKAGRLIVWIENVDTTSATVHIQWVPPVGSTKLILKSASISGGSVDGAPNGQLIRPNRLWPHWMWNPYSLNPGDSRVLVRRGPGEPAIRVVLDGTTGEAHHSFSTESYFPAATKIEDTSELSAPILSSDLRPVIKPPVYKYCASPPGGGRRDPSGLYNVALLRWAVATATSEYGEPEHFTKHLNDGYVTNCASWIPRDADTAPSGTIDLIHRYWIKKIVLKNGHPDGRTSHSIQFDASIDGKNFTNIGSWNGPLAPDSPVQLIVTPNQPFRFVRFVITKWDNMDRWGPRVDEFEIYGDVRR